VSTCGTLRDAIGLYYQHEHDVADDRLGWVEPCGAGEDRTVYRIGEVAYKIPTRPTANPYDHHMQEEARRRGYRWAPAASTLWTFTDLYGDDVAVLAMPYLESDGSTAAPALMAEMQEQAGGQVDGTNYVVIAGQPIVIDFCTVNFSGQARSG
jgi:hypothetical protein